LEDWSCQAFASEAELDAYTQQIAPHRELVCPITQELMRDPVVAEDGHTYERDAILRWFSVGRSRSPVTNAILRGHGVFNNLAVQTMAIAHRERLGLELLKRCEYIYRNDGQCQDKGARIGALLDAGADLTLRDHEGPDGHTALLFLIQARQVKLALMLLEHDAPVTLLTSDGHEYIQAAQIAMRRNSNATVDEWKLLIEEISAKATREIQARQDRELARTQANQERREEQRSLALEQRRARLNGGADNSSSLGQLEPGWGYFPSLAALQFQGSIPPPSRSVAEFELRERQRLTRILFIIATIVFTYFLIS